MQNTYDGHSIRDTNMSVFGDIVGAQEGIEAGLATTGLAASERFMAQAVSVGLGLLHWVWLQATLSAKERLL